MEAINEGRPAVLDKQLRLRPKDVRSLASKVTGVDVAAGKGRGPPFGPLQSIPVVSRLLRLARPDHPELERTMTQSTRFSNLPARTDGSDRPRWETDSAPAASAWGYSERDPEPRGPGTRSRIHRKLMDRLNLASLAERDREEGEAEIAKVVRQMLADEMAPLNMEEREQVVEQILYEIFGLGPLEPLLKDPPISDILVNTSDQVFIERNGRLEEAKVASGTTSTCCRSSTGSSRRWAGVSTTPRPWWTPGSPTAPGSTPSCPPLAMDGPHLSIRKFRRDVLSADQLLSYGSLTPRSSPS
jgi:hypothetical protein